MDEVDSGRMGENPILITLFKVKEYNLLLETEQKLRMGNKSGET